jgi:hypothetical protein
MINIINDFKGISYNSTAKRFAIIVGVLSLIPMHVLTKVMADLGDLRF